MLGKVGAFTPAFSSHPANSSLSDTRRLQVHDGRGIGVVANSLGAGIEDKGRVLPDAGCLGEEAKELGMIRRSYMGKSSPIFY